ncbi:MAG: DODA-type extradiol aromatic ring-opening family dioxygenase, partial [Fidelibacterota bacterium]
MNVRAPIVYIPHGGGPLPLMGDPGHERLVSFLQNLPNTLETPDAILIISAHWETDVPTVTGGDAPGLLYDYAGFPPEAYTIQYPAPGAPVLADHIVARLDAAGFPARHDDRRGFDHGVFIPLKLMYPAATIPCVQLSLLRSLDPAAHLRLGQALCALPQQNILIVGSGFSFHNLRAFFQHDSQAAKESAAFQDWLAETCTSPDLPRTEREHRLRHWEQAPAARYCHPRAEHLLPLHVCFGMAGNIPAEVVFRDDVIDIPVIGLLW